MEQFNFNEAVKKAADGSIFIEPTCRYFGINYDYQKDQVIGKKETLKELRRNFAAEDVFGDKKQRLCLEKKGYTLWILQLVPSNITVSKRDLFQFFQQNFFEYVWNSIETNQKKKDDVQSIAMELHFLYKQKTALQKRINALNNIKNTMLETTPDEWVNIRGEYMGQLELFTQKQLNA
jgi:hypothetical protein